MPIKFQVSILKVTMTQNKRGQTIKGVYVGISHWDKLKPTALSFYMMALSIELSPKNPFIETKRSALFNKHVGSTAWWNELTEYKRSPRVRQFLRKWEHQSSEFREQVQPFLIYK